MTIGGWSESWGRLLVGLAKRQTLGRTLRVLDVPQRDGMDLGFFIQGDDAADGGRPIQGSVLGDEGIPLSSDVVGKGAGAPISEVDVDAEQFVDGGDALIADAEHEVHEMEELVVADQGARIDFEFIAHAQLGEITRILLDGKAAIGGLVVVMAEAKFVVPIPGGAVEKVGVPHDVHVAEEIEVLFGHLAFEVEGQLGEVFRGGERGHTGIIRER